MLPAAPQSTAAEDYVALRSHENFRRTVHLMGRASSAGVQGTGTQVVRTKETRTGTEVRLAGGNTGHPARRHVGAAVARRQRVRAGTEKNFDGQHEVVEVMEGAAASASSHNEGRACLLPAGCDHPRETDSRVHEQGRAQHDSDREAKGFDSVRVQPARLGQCGAVPAGPGTMLAMGMARDHL